MAPADEPSDDSGDEPGDDLADGLLDRTTLLLRRFQEGSADADEQLFGMLYDELRGLARRQMNGVGGAWTLQATALVHELWIRLRTAEGIRVESRHHFMHLAARAMRGMLVDRARARAAAKREGGRERVPLDDALEVWEADSTVDPLVLDELLAGLRAQDARLADVVELRFFAGLTQEETAEVLGLTRRQAQHAWSLARAWLIREFERDSGSHE